MQCGKPVTQEEFELGYAVCGCGKFAHVFRMSVLSKLPKDSELVNCQECRLWMVPVAQIKDSSGT